MTLSTPQSPKGHLPCCSRFRLRRLKLILWSLTLSLIIAAPAVSNDQIDALFMPDARNQRVIDIEAAISLAQADVGFVDADGAAEVASKANTSYAPLPEIDAEYDRVRHRMVALLNVWRRSLSDEASNALHKGVTTVDVYDTVLVLQVLDAIDLMEADMLALEGDLLCLAEQYKSTPMMGRTLGQHALPITFGKKVASWAAQTRRNIERLDDVRQRLRRSGVLKGAVGTHAGLGPDGMRVEAGVSERLGLEAPDPADWRAARDNFAEYAQTLALIAKSHAAIGAEIFRLQSTDVGELYERRRASAVGSSTMPHKHNPSLSEALVHYGRTIPATASVILDDVEAVYERDNTSRTNRTLEEMTQEAGDMIAATRRLISRLEIKPDQMRANIDRTGGLIMSQRILLFLGEHMSREAAEHALREAVTDVLETDVTYRNRLLTDPVLGPLLAKDIDDLLNPETALGLSREQVDAVRAMSVRERARAGQPSLAACSSPAE